MLHTVKPSYSSRVVMEIRQFYKIQKCKNLWLKDLTPFRGKNVDVGYIFDHFFIFHHMNVCEFYYFSCCRIWWSKFICFGHDLWHFLYPKFEFRITCLETEDPRNGRFVRFFFKFYTVVSFGIVQQIYLVELNLLAGLLPLLWGNLF